MVTTQANITFLKRDQSTTSLDRTLPTITTEPTLQWVVLIGIPRFEAHSTVSAEPISITKPLKPKSNQTHISYICRIPLCRESAKLSLKKNALYLSVKVFSTKVLTGDTTFFTSPTVFGTAILHGHSSHAKV